MVGNIVLRTQVRKRQPLGAVYIEEHLSPSPEEILLGVTP